MKEKLAKNISPDPQNNRAAFQGRRKHHDTKATLSRIMSSSLQGSKERNLSAGRNCKKRLKPAPVVGEGRKKADSRGASEYIGDSRTIDVQWEAFCFAFIVLPA